MMVQLPARILYRIVEQPETLGDGDCEALHGGLVGQPVNTITSLGYVAGGAWLLTRVGRLDRSERVPATAYGLAVALSGVGSVAYHGPQFAGAQLLHDLPIVMMVGIGVGVPIVRAVRGRRVVGENSRSRLRGAAAAGVIGGLSYLGGRTGASTCDPDSLLQFHGAWHLATALAATMWGGAVWSLDERTSDLGDEPQATHG